MPYSPKDVSRGEVAMLNSKLSAGRATARSGAIPDDVPFGVALDTDEDGVGLLVVPTNEELEIGAQTLRCIQGRRQPVD